MQTQEIPNPQWGQFLDDLTRCHAGESVSVEVDGTDVGAQPQAEGVRLIGITFDCKDSIGDEIDVVVGNTDTALLTHAVQHPSHIRIARTDDGFDSALQLESRDGPSTLVRFNLPAQHPMQSQHSGEQKPS